MKLINKYFEKGTSIKPVLVVFLVIGLIQSIFTNIGFDEAYYWRFAQDLDWGYFDHPPMVALMIAIGNSFLPGTLGIRLMTIALSLLTYYVIWLLIPQESRNKEGSVMLFFLLIIGNPLLNIYSFITTPDVPLIFFSALYLLQFQRFLSKKNLKSALLLGLTMACLIYSKYHGLLVILITVVSQPKLFKSPLFYLSGITGIVLYLPHLYWQYQHDFISFIYHLSYRSVLFNIKNVYVYFINILLVLNPFLFPLFLIGYFKNAWKSGIHNRTFNTIIWGFLLFFAFTSFRGHVEPQWIVVVSIPMIVYFHQYLTRFENIKKFFKPLAVISLVLILIARTGLMLPLPLNSEFHRPGKEFYREINNLARGKPVVFTNSYTQSARYSYYTGDDAFSYNFVSFRKNQYDIWDYHSKLHGKDVLMITFFELGRFRDTLLADTKHVYYKEYEKIPIVNNIKVEILEYAKVIPAKGEFKVKFSVYNPYDTEIDFSNSERPISWLFYFFFLDKERSDISYMLPQDLKPLSPKSTTVITGVFSVETTPGKYTFGMQILPRDVFPITVSKRTYPITVIEGGQ